MFFTVVCMHHTSGIVLSGFVYATVMMMELSLCNIDRVCVCSSPASVVCVRERPVRARASFCG